MKSIFVVVLLSGIASADCGVSDALLSARPGAQWVLKGSDYSGLQWLDKSQSQPSLQEVNAAISLCQTSKVSKKTQASADSTIIANPQSTTDQRLNALIDLLQNQSYIPASANAVVAPVSP